MKTQLIALISVLIFIGADCLKGESRIRVADYNIKFLSVADLNAKPQRKQRLRAVIEQLKPDIIALQEIKDRQALEELFEPNTWSILIDDDSNDDQDLAIVVKRPLKFQDREDLDADDADFLRSGLKKLEGNPTKAATPGHSGALRCGPFDAHETHHPGETIK